MKGDLPAKESKSDRYRKGIFQLKKGIFQVKKGQLL
jgi:hypothetical protein